MNKKMRELQNEISRKAEEAKNFLTDGESKDLKKATALLDEIDNLQNEIDLEGRLEAHSKETIADVGAPIVENKTVNGFDIMRKKLTGQLLSAVENTALITGTDATQGEGYLIPDDVRAEINTLRKSYVSAKDIVSTITTDALSGSINYEAGAPAGLTAFDDGDTITEETGMSFVKKTFTICWMGKMIPISRILIGAEKVGIRDYLNRWFVRNAILSENAKIFNTLKTSYGSTAKAVAGWKALKKSVTVDLDPSCLMDGVIVTNQSGFACLDEEEDSDGRPVLQYNPAQPTQKMFQGLPIKVFPDAQLANITTGSGTSAVTTFPMLYGATKAGALFVENTALEFNVSEHYLFGKNQNCLRVVEGFDVISTDTGAYIYANFAPTAKS